MKKNVFVFISCILIWVTTNAQITNLTDAQGLPEGTYTFNLGNGDFQGYIDSEGWLLWMQYHHQGETNPPLSVILPGNDLPIFDNSPLGTDLSGDPSKWGHGSQAFAASIPDDDLWLRWEAVTSYHDRKVHFESPVLGKFQSNSEPGFVPEISFMNFHREDHTANLPNSATTTPPVNEGDYTLCYRPFKRGALHTWQVRDQGRWTVDDVRNDNGDLILSEYHTIHRVWVKPIPFDSEVLDTALDDLKDHINGVITLSDEELTQIKTLIFLYGNHLADSPSFMTKAQCIVSDYDSQVGALFTTPHTEDGFDRDPQDSPHLNLERAVLALQQAQFDFVFTPEVLAEHPEFIDGVKFNASQSFPGAIDPPVDPTITHTTSIRANFADPEGINPIFTMNSDGTAHAFRPTGMYLAPGSIVTITVPESLVGKDYYIRVGAHEWDLTNKKRLKRLDRISKKFPINTTTIEVFNPMGGAIGILVPYEAAEGIVEVTLTNAQEAPFFSLKSFYETPDFDAELQKPAPWAVFETDNVMYTIPKHNIVPGEYDLRQTLMDWDTALQGINSILSRQIISDKHDLYMINDVFVRRSVFSIGYPQSNNKINFANIPGPPQFIDGPGPRYDANFHELGHSIRISKFPGETEAVVNFLYVMAMNHGLGEALDQAVNNSMGHSNFDIDQTATHRLVSNTFGTERNISGSTMNEVRYQHRGYGHYFEIVDLIGWCSHINFWKKEYIDFQNGLDHGINGQDIDSRILRMSIAAGEDLRPLLHVFGILPQDPIALQAAFEENEIPKSQTIYNRLQEYITLIPEDNLAFVDYALSVYPNLFTAGPDANPDFGIGWHYQKTLTYTSAEATERISILLGIIDLYYPSGEPDPSTEEICCMFDEIFIELVGGEALVTGGTPPYDVTTDIVGDLLIVTVIDFNGCEATEEFPILGTSEFDSDAVIVYPNPTKGKLFISIKDTLDKITTVQLISISGQEILTQLEDGMALNLSGVSTGLYLLKIGLDNGTVVYKKIVVDK